MDQRTYYQRQLWRLLRWRLMQKRVARLSRAIENFTEAVRDELMPRLKAFEKALQELKRKELEE